MKKYFILSALACLANLFYAQTLHKQYPVNYCGTGNCHQTTAVYGGRYYVAFLEDTTFMPSGKENLTLIKSDLSGNVIWKRTFRFATTYTASAAPRKIIAAGSNIYIGGNLVEPSAQYPFIASVDTANGNVNYFNRYISSFSSTDVKINDLTLLNNGDVIAVGRIVSGVNKFFYCLRVAGNTGTIINNGMSTYYFDQEATSVCQFSNGSIFIAGTKGLYPFIAKLNNNSALTPAGSYLISGGMPVSSSFNQIIKSGNNLVIMGSTSGTGQNNFIVRIDSNVNMSVGSPYILTHFTSNSFLPTYLYQNGLQTLVSGVTSGGNSLLFYNPMLTYQGGYAYGSTGSMDHSIQYYNNNTYLTTGTWFTGSNLRLYKGDINGLTSCATSVTPTFSLLTVTYTVGQIGVFSNGSLNPVIPQVYNRPIVPVTTCLTTEVNSYTENLADIKVFTSNEAFVFDSQVEMIKEIVIYDINGKLIYSQNQLNTHQQNFEISQLSAGLYIAKITYGTNQKTVKLIKN